MQAFIEGSPLTTDDEGIPCRKLRSFDESEFSLVDETLIEDYQRFAGMLQKNGLAVTETGAKYLFTHNNLRHWSDASPVVTDVTDHPERVMASKALATAWDCFISAAKRIFVSPLEKDIFGDVQGEGRLAQCCALRKLLVYLELHNVVYDPLPAMMMADGLVPRGEKEQMNLGEYMEATGYFANGENPVVNVAVVSDRL